MNLGEFRRLRDRARLRLPAVVRFVILKECLTSGEHEIETVTFDVRLYHRFRVISIQINVWKDAAVCVPAPYLRLVVAQGELFSG